MEMHRPDEILRRLHEHGFEAYYVGGCVRDTLLGRTIHDWDITTSALPEQTMQCFDHCIPTGIKHGTVTVLVGNTQAEVTTYRTDGNYIDNRHPEQVTFVRDLSQDLARRDFTINAMAMDYNGTVTDLYGGMEDLRNKRIRCVGNADVRFQEDALRMLRAFRFSAQLGFEIEDKTKAAIKRNSLLCHDLSAERVRDEMEKTLCSPHPEKLDEMAHLGLLDRCNPAPDHSCGWLSKLPCDAMIRWAGLCRTWPKMDLSVLRLSKRVTVNAAAGRYKIPQNQLEWKRMIAECGREQSLILAAMVGMTADVESLFSSGECLSLQQLAVSGADFPQLSGPEVGRHLKKLLYYVLEHPQENKKEILLNL